MPSHFGLKNSLVGLSKKTKNFIYRSTYAYEYIQKLRTRFFVFLRKEISKFG
jgi:hypothetical protein